MIRSLQKRFVLAAMLSLLVLLLILIGGITGVSYLTMERNTDRALEMLSSNVIPPRPEGGDRRPMFGYQIAPNPSLFMNHFIVTMDAQGNVAAVDSGFTAADETEIRGYAAQAAEAGRQRGKAGAYKYLLTPQEGGGSKIVFLDASAQARMLEDTLRAACAIGLLCMALMFVILLAVSRRAMRPIADNMEKQRRFVTDAGHEIKTPLAIILANTDAMELHLGESKWSGRIREQTLRLDGLMKQLISLSKTDEGGDTRQLEEVSLSSIVEACVADFSSLDSGRRIHAEIALKVLVRGDRDGLAQLTSILLDNAIKYSKEGGDIFVRLERAGKRAVLEVRNTCDALPEVEPRVLFDRFYRADAARSQKGGGYGIGLSIARAIAEQHKGKIAAYYDDAQTIRFRVEL